MLENDFKSNTVVRLFRKYHPLDVNFALSDRTLIGIPDYLIIQQDIVTSLELKVVRNGRTKIRPLQIPIAKEINESGIKARGAFLCRMEFDSLGEVLFCVLTPEHMEAGIYKDINDWMPYAMTYNQLESWIENLPHSSVPS